MDDKPKRVVIKTQDFNGRPVFELSDPYYYGFLNKTRFDSLVIEGYFKEGEQKSQQSVVWNNLNLAQALSATYVYLSIIKSAKYSSQAILEDATTANIKGHETKDFGEKILLSYTKISDENERDIVLNLYRTIYKDVKETELGKLSEATQENEFLRNSYEYAVALSDKILQDYLKIDQNDQNYETYKEKLIKQLFSQYLATSIYEFGLNNLIDTSSYERIAKGLSAFNKELKFNINTKRVSNKNITNISFDFGGREIERGLTIGTFRTNVSQFSPNGKKWVLWIFEGDGTRTVIKQGEEVNFNISPDSYFVVSYHDDVNKDENDLWREVLDPNNQYVYAGDVLRLVGSGHLLSKYQMFEIGHVAEGIVGGEAIIAPPIQAIPPLEVVDDMLEEEELDYPSAFRGEKLPLESPVRAKIAPPYRPFHALPVARSEWILEDVRAVERLSLVNTQGGSFGVQPARELIKYLTGKQPEGSSVDDVTRELVSAINNAFTGGKIDLDIGEELIIDANEFKYKLAIVPEEGVNKLKIWVGTENERGDTDWVKLAEGEVNVDKIDLIREIGMIRGIAPIVASVNFPNLFEISGVYFSGNLGVNYLTKRKKGGNISQRVVGERLSREELRALGLDSPTIVSASVAASTNLSNTLRNLGAHLPFELGLSVGIGERNILRALKKGKPTKLFLFGGMSVAKSFNTKGVGLNFSIGTNLIPVFLDRSSLPKATTTNFDFRYRRLMFGVTSGINFRDPLSEPYGFRLGLDTNKDGTMDYGASIIMFGRIPIPIFYINGKSIINWGIEGIKWLFGIDKKSKVEEPPKQQLEEKPQQSIKMVR